MAYNALAKASVIIELFDNEDKYEAVVASTNGVMLQPYDTSTTLIGSVLKNNVDVTKNISNIRWTKWNPSSDNLIECPEWNEKHIGMNIIEVAKEDVDSKSVFTFEAYNGRDELLCSASISIIDINDLLVSTIKPTNPYIGQVWIDDSTEPAKIYVWNGYKWVLSGAVGAIAKNLLRNTNFLNNAQYWDIVGDTRLSYTPVATDYLGHRFLKLTSEVLTDENRGISQTTIDKIVPKSEYSFQMIFYSKTDTQTFSNNIIVNIYSVDSKDERTLLYTNTIEAEAKLKQLYAKFKSLSDTDKITVEILGEPGYRYNFYVAELALYNTWNEYPWTINPGDLASVANYTQEELWNILSNNGTVQGIFSQINPITGQLDYYINASMIGAGKVKAEFMEMYGLKVARKDNPDLITFEVTEDGRINMIVDELRIGTNAEELDSYINSYINSSIDISTEGILARVVNLEEDTESLFEITDRGIYLSSSGDGSQSLVDINNQEILIRSNSLRLEGYTTINNGFSVDLEGNMTANNGRFSGTIIASDIRSDETEDPTFSLTTDGVLTANEANIRGNISGTIPALEELTSSSGKFRVDGDGILYAEGAVITGSITAGSTIEGAEIIGSIIRSSSDSFSIDSDGNIYGGSININNRFRVSSNGALFATSANITGNINTGSNVIGSDISGSTISGSVITGSVINVLGKDDGYAEFIYDILLEDGYMKMTNRLHPDDEYLHIRSNALYNNSIKESLDMNGNYIKSIFNDMYLGDGHLYFMQKTFDKYYGDQYSNYDSYTYTLWSTDHFEINDGWIRGKDLVCINSIKCQPDADYRSEITGEDTVTIYDNNTKTLYADHFDKGYNTIGDFSGGGIDEGNAIITLGDSVIIYGSYTFDNIDANTTGSVIIEFDDIPEYVYGSNPLSDAPYITLTLQTNNPSAYTCSVSDVTKAGFTLWCSSIYDSSVTVCWMAIGAAKTNRFANVIYEDFSTLDNVTLVSGAYESDTPRVFY